MTKDHRLLEKLARQMIYLDRLIVDVRRRGEFDYAQQLEEQRVNIQQQRSMLMRQDTVYDD